MSSSSAQLQTLLEGCRLAPVLADRFDSPRLQQFYIADFVSLKFPTVMLPEAREAFCIEIDKAARRELDARRDEFEVIDAEDIPMEDGDNNDASRNDRFARFVTPADVAVAFSKLKNRLQGSDSIDKLLG